MKYLIHDNSVQWFSYAISTAEKQDPDLAGTWVEKAFDVNNLAYSPLLSEICSREEHFLNRFFQGSNIQSGDYYGWTITEKEWEQIRRACEATPKPTRPLNIRVYEGEEVSDKYKCALCGSSLLRKWMFWRSTGCIQPKCSNHDPRF